ncbi:YjcZ family sporulation protein [Bacillus gaemokensis]|nr:YjcZ family sporulation protein [Bacillus gaemokensis]KYG27257.1 ABC transporter substrate-binding protein [Bacillus gaemokensis]
MWGYGYPGSYCGYGYGGGSCGTGAGFALLVVLFILLIIIGACWVR